MNQVLFKIIIIVLNKNVKTSVVENGKEGVVNAGLLSLELRSMLNANNWKLNGNNMNSGFETTDSQSNWASEHPQVTLNTILTGSRYMLVDVVNMFNLCCLACVHKMSSALHGQ